MKKHKKILITIIIVLILLILCLVWGWSSYIVYKGYYLNGVHTMIWALRSNFMAKVIVPIITASIAFYGIYKTVTSNNLLKKIEHEREKEEKILMIYKSVLDEVNKIDKHCRSKINGETVGLLSKNDFLDINEYIYYKINELLLYGVELKISGILSSNLILIIIFISDNQEKLLSGDREEIFVIQNKYTELKGDLIKKIGNYKKSTDN